MLKSQVSSQTQEKIQDLKKKRNAVVLAHNYQLPEVQEVADFRGDSLELARFAAKTEADVVVLCGVDFMAQTASILCPDKKVIMPDASATCPMANMLSVEQLRELKQKYPQAVVVGYVNSTSQIKAELDVCCTSSNAVAVVNAYRDAKDIIFVPDKFLADFVFKKTGRKLITWNGFCPIHIRITPEDIKRAKKFHPKAKVLVHPECPPEVIAMADEALSTAQMGQYAKNTKAKEIIIGTETGIIYRLKEDNPDIEFYPVSERAVCPNMKKTTQELILRSLETMQKEIRVSEPVRKKALKAIERMLEIC
jgi:quinolinate synthase